jgi:UDP:flavonoid glycosyltransferase YjiC (YdhE family)
MRALVCSLDSPGFLYPAIGLAAELRVRGHEVAFVTDRGARARLAQAGFERVPRGGRDGSSFQTGSWSLPLAISLQVAHVEHALGELNPDLIVGQALALGPLIVRERWGLPVAVQGHATHAWPGAAASSEAERREAWRHRTMLRLLNEARALARLPARQPGLGPDALENPLLGDLFLVRSVPELDGLTAILPDLAHHVGACLWEPGAPPDDELAAWVGAARQAGAPIVYAYHGRCFGGQDVWAALVGASAGGALRIAAATGRMDSQLEQTMTAGHFHLRRDLEPSRVLRHADLMIGSATSAAVLGALSHGVPCLLLPTGDEQAELAERVEHAGAGRILLPKAATPAALRRSIQEVLGDESMRRQARRLERAFARFAGFAAAADLLESLAASSSRRMTRVMVRAL